MSLEDRSVNELHATDRLPEYVRGRLSDDERADVEAHLASCPACGEELQILEAVLAAPEPRLEPSEVERLYTPLPPPGRTAWRAGAERTERSTAHGPLTKRSPAGKRTSPSCIRVRWICEPRSGGPMGRPGWSSTARP